MEKLAWLLYWAVIAVLVAGGIWIIITRLLGPAIDQTWQVGS